MQHRLRVETLEGRDCPAATITTNLSNGILTVEGTDGNDSLVVTQSGGYLAVVGQLFNAAQVNLIVITGEGGNDGLVNATAKPAMIYGGSGHDTLVSGTGHDILYAGPLGNVLVNRGTSVLWGGNGPSQLIDATGRGELHHGSPNLQRGNTALETQIIQLLNAARVAAGLQPLAASAQLNAAADLHSQDMAAAGTATNNIFQSMQHTLYGTTRPTLTDRLADAGYDNWTHAAGWGENIAAGFTSAQTVVTGWMNSPGHRANILDPNYTDIGVSVRTDSHGVLYFTTDFGYRS